MNNTIKQSFSTSTTRRFIKREGGEEQRENDLSKMKYGTAGWIVTGTELPARHSLFYYLAGAVSSGGSSGSPSPSERTTDGGPGVGTDGATGAVPANAASEADRADAGPRNGRGPGPGWLDLEKAEGDCGVKAVDSSLTYAETRV